MTFLFYFLTIAGLIIGLGAVTVIDVHGFLAQKSYYWTEATIRSHKITKPLIWIGMFLFLAGFLFLYQGTMLFIQITLALVMIINGSFLTFHISPFLLGQEKKKLKTVLPKKIQRKIFLSFLLSFFSWWSSVFLFVLFLVHR